MYFNEIEQEHYESQQRRYLDELSLEKQEERRIQNAVDNKTLEFAKLMKNKGELIEKIMDYTGLSKDQIDKI